ncbi:GspE/PulE family protein [Patescibacteria group bacterium]|nr:GspE/PulE family protein [Patescibacteria group bacterium]
MLKVSFQKRLLDALKAENLISLQTYNEYLKIIKDNPRKLDQLLEDNSLITPEVLAQFKGKVLKIPYLSLEGKIINKDVLKILPQDLAENYQLLVFDKIKNELQVGLVDPTNYKAVEAIEFLARKKNLEVKYYIISSQSFALVFKEYESMKEEMVEALGFAEKKFAPQDFEGKEGVTSLEDVIKTAPVSKILSVILRNAVEGRASDIHIEPHADKSRVRYRIDGILHTSLVLPIYVHTALVSRIKVLANLKIDETRLPQDGRVRQTITGKKVDFRISIIPLVNQEKVVMRILESPDKAPTFEDLGFMGRQIKLMVDNLKRPNGMFLVTGPTGSGKSTTLFSALSILNQEGINIITLEDPVEYFITGVNQSQVKSEIGYSFANGLRAFLRQDPNIIMVGEIRDVETVELAIHAALTGHLVLSTLHTNDAKGSIHRLIDMKAQPFLLATTINVIIAQRLVRKICEKCKVKDKVPPDVLEDVKKDLSTMPPGGWYDPLKDKRELIFYKGAGCNRCGESGYKGRLSLAEILVVNTRMKDIIAHGFHQREVDEELKNQNFVTLGQDGWMKALLGHTTAEEVLRVTKTEM